MFRLLLALLRNPLRGRTGREAPAESDFDLSLTQRLSRPSDERSILAGSIQLIGLDDVRRDLGILWTRVSDKVYRIAHEEISARLSEGDTFRRCNNETFLICFWDSDEELAARIAAEISAGIRARTRSEIPAIAGRIGVSATTAAVKTDHLRGADNVSDRLLALLRSVRDDMERTVENHRSTLLGNCVAQFFPAISPNKNRIVFNTCAVSMASGIPSLSSFRTMADPKQYQEALSSLDLKLLVSAVEALHLSSKQRGCCPILVPVRLDSLREHATREEYIKLLQEIPERYVRFILLEVTGLATAADGLDFIFVAPEVQTHVKRLVLEVALGMSEHLALAEFPIWGVSTSLADRSSIDPELPTRLRRYVQWAAKNKLSAIAHRANSLGLALLAQKAGFNIIDGPAVHAATPQPKPPFPVAPLDRASAIVPVAYRKG